MVSSPGLATAPDDTLGVVRRAVRSVVDRVPALEHDPELRRKIAKRMVHVSLAAAALLEDDKRITDELRERRVASAMAAPGDPSMGAVRAAAGTVQGLKNAIDFPTFVTQLITGVFTAITTSTLQQLEAFADLLDGVSGATPSISGGIPSDSAVRWLTSHFDAFKVDQQPDQPIQITLREDAEMPSTDILKATLDATDDEVSAIDDSDLGSTLLPLVRRKIGRSRQSILSTMVLMGMQRVVVDEGKLHASMELAVDARSTEEQRHASQTDFRTSASGSASFGIGNWGASASVSTSVGYVKSDQEYSREDIAARAGLRSSVDVTFRTEQIPLDRMANKEALARIRNNSRVPEAEWHPQNLLGDEKSATKAPDFAKPPDVPIPKTPPVQFRGEPKKEKAAADKAKDAKPKEDATKKSPSSATPPPGNPAAAPAPAKTGETAPGLS